MIGLEPKSVLRWETAQGRLAKAPVIPLVTPRKYGILVVDDEGCVRAVLEIGMRQQGFAVWVAAGGLEALDLYGRHQETIDVVLIDVRMPEIDGPQTLAALQALNPQIRFCFMSGDLGSYTARGLYNLGADVIIQKPFCVAEVAQTLWELASRPELSLCSL